MPKYNFLWLLSHGRLQTKYMLEKVNEKSVEMIFNVIRKLVPH